MSGRDKVYEQQGWGRPIGFGATPAVLVIDMQNDFCDPGAPTTLAPQIGETFEPIRRLCDEGAKARRAGHFTPSVSSPLTTPPPDCGA